MIGKIDGKILEAILETIPIEFSVLNEDDKVLAWNKHETRIFKRPEAALGRDVRQCHPERSLDKVEQIISEMKEGIRDKARFWIDLPLGKNGEKEKVMIEYYALRDQDGNYLGCLESSQNIATIQKLEGQKRLLD
ncbi:MAG: PAS domain-containing protein [Candidatus Methanofastidiosum sp.]|nr:PAS domain-containing protein [Methanofastidiosum sp.]NYT13959.1 PAS domain-containing protein [Candidatus Methanofastidiosa archaeon]